MNSKINKAVEILKKGGVIIYPTETLYGLGADATNSNAIKKVYKIKGRNFKKPLPIAVVDVKMAKKFVEWNENADVLAKVFLPGPLTLVLESKRNLPRILNRGSKKIGIRIPSHLVALSILKKIKRPLTTTSANISGKNATDYKTVKNQIGNKVDMMIPCNCRYKKPSTVIDLTSKKPKILRVGVISKKQIEKALRESPRLVK